MNQKRNWHWSRDSFTLIGMLCTPKPFHIAIHHLLFFFSLIWLISFTHQTNRKEFSHNTQHYRCNFVRSVRLTNTTHLFISLLRKANLHLIYYQFVFVWCDLCLFLLCRTAMNV